MLSLKLHLFPCSQLMIVTQQESSRASGGSMVGIQIVLNQPSTTAQTSRWKAQNEFTGWTSVLLLVSLLELLRPTCSLHFNLSSAHFHMSMNPVTYTGILLLKTLYQSPFICFLSHPVCHCHPFCTTQVRLYRLSVRPVLLASLLF